MGTLPSPASPSAPTPSPFEKGSLRFRKWKFQGPGGQPHNLLGASGGPKGLFLATRLGAGMCVCVRSWDLRAFGLLRCEEASLTSPKVSSILDTPSSSP
ncbi:hypothetical protein VULLAG_LOCUS15247 [Vulpes lagopus]